MLDKPSEYIRAIEEDPFLVHLTGSNGYTIFHKAARYGRLQVMEAINNIDTHMKDRVDKYNYTTLMFASMNDHAACVKWLLDHEVDVNIKDVYRRSVLDFAKSQEVKDMIKRK